MNNFPGVNEMLALLDTLKGVAGDFAAREEKLNTEFTGRANRELNTQESRVGTLQARVSQFSAQAEQMLAAEQARREVRFQNRKAVINRAHRALKKQTERDADAQSTGLNDSVRTNTVLAERRRDEELANEAANHQTFQQSLADSSAKLEQLKKTAHKSFRGCRKFRRWLTPGQPWPEPDFSPDEHQLLEEFYRLTVKIGGDLGRFGKYLAPLIFGFIPLWLISVLLLGVGVAPALQRFGIHLIPPVAAGASLAGLLCVWIFYWLGMRSAAPLATEIARDVFKAQRLLDGGYEKSEARHAAEQQRIKDECDLTIQTVNQDWQQQTKKLTSSRSGRLQAVDEKGGRTDRKHYEFHQAGLERFKRQQAETFSQLQQEAITQTRQFTETHNATMAELNLQRQEQWQVLEGDWKKAIEPLWAEIGKANAVAGQLFPEWSDPAFENGRRRRPFRMQPRWRGSK